MKLLQKITIILVAALGGLALTMPITGCATTNGVTTLDPTAQSVLSAIQGTAASLASSGALPSTGKTAGIVSDVQTISNALETANTGTGISPTAAASIAASFHSNAATTNYVTLGATIIDALIPAVNALINSGASTSTVQAITTQVLTNAPAAVAAGVSGNTTPITPATTNAMWNPARPEGWQAGDVAAN